MTSPARPARTDEPAYPSHGTMGEVVQTGMTLREAFAKAAMQGLLACSHPYRNANGYLEARSDLVHDAADMADRLIAELAKPTEYLVIAAWMKGHRTHTDMGEDYDVEIVEGRDAPPGDGWLPLYRKVKP